MHVRHSRVNIWMIHTVGKKISTNLISFGRISQVQSTKSCLNCGEINLNSIGMSTVPGGTVQTKILSTNQKGLGTNSDLLQNARWNIHFSCTDHCRVNIWMIHIPYVCIYMYIHVCTYTYIYTLIYVYMYTYICIYIYMCICTYICVWMMHIFLSSQYMNDPYSICMYIYVHTRMYIHI